MSRLYDSSSKTCEMQDLSLMALIAPHHTYMRAAASHTKEENEYVPATICTELVICPQ